MSVDLVAVNDELARLASAIRTMAEAQAVQTELLRLILEAATADQPSDDLFGILRQISDQIERLTDRLAGLGLPPSENFREGG